MMLMGSTKYQAARHKLALQLMDIGAVLTRESDHPLVIERRGKGGLERGFKLKLHESKPTAPLSPIYLNLRVPHNEKPGPLTSGIVDLAARCMRSVQLEAGLQFDAISGVPNAGDPFAASLAKLCGKPCIPLTKRGTGDRRQIGWFKSDVPVSLRKFLLVDDLIALADSKLEAVNVFRDAGRQASDIIVLVDREQGGRKKLAQKRCSLHSVFVITELLDLYVEFGRMQPQLQDEILEYLRSAP